MLRPALAVARRGEQLIHELFVSLRILALHKGIDLLLRRRQAVQHESDAADQLRAIRLRRGREAELRVFFRDEPIDVIAHPLRVHLRRLRIRQRLKAPELPVLLREAKLVRLLALALAGRPRSPHFHPILQRGDLFGRELLFRRHGDVFVLIPHRLDEQGFAQIPRHDRRTARAALFQMADVIHAQITLLFFLAVALVAALHQQRTHLVFKKRHRSAAGIIRRDGGGGGEQQKDCG